MQVFNVTDGGVVTVVKQAGTPAEIARLAHEREWLRRAAHPGVVQLAEPAGAPPERLTTRDAGVDLAHLGALAPDEISGLGAAIATILADLHDLGIGHHRVRAEHVLVGPGGAPALCGFGDAGPLVVGGRDDVRALASILLDLPAAEAGRLGRTLRRAVAGKTAARALAASLARATTAGRSLPDTSPAARAVKKQGRQWRRPGLVAGGLAAGGIAAAVAAAVVGLAAASLHARARRPEAAPPVACPAVDAHCRPVVVRGGVFVAGGRRWQLAAADPVVVIGRWTCGAALPAVLDRSTGEIWAFPAWRGAGDQVVAAPVAHVERAVDLRVVPSTTGCDRLAVERRDQRPLVLEVSR